MRPSRMMAIATTFLFAVASASAAELSNRDKDYLRERASLFMADVRAGELASHKAQTELVRAFAYRLVNDHKRSLEQIRKLAAARKVELPAAPSDRDLKTVTELEGVTGTRFDKRYIERAIRQHKAGTKADRQRSQGSKDPELRTLATASFEVEDLHLALANRALANVPVE